MRKKNVLYIFIHKIHRFIRVYLQPNTQLEIPQRSMCLNTLENMTHVRMAFFFAAAFALFGVVGDPKYEDGTHSTNFECVSLSSR